MHTGRFLVILSFFLLAIITSAQPQPAEYRMSRQEYIDRFKEESVREMHTYGIPASITLAQGILESGDGNSPLARYANNHFGIKCHKGWVGPTFIQDDDAKNECFRKYHSPEESYRDHSEFLKNRPRYAFLFDLKITDYQGWAHGLKQAGYATNPKYPELLIKIIEDNKLYEFDRMAPLQAAKQKATPVAHVKPVKEENSHNIKVTSIELNNNVKFVLAQRGDTPEIIAKRLLMKPGQIIKYNEFSKEITIKEGDVIYIQPKRNKGQQEFHILQEGEDLFKVSQKYGVKLKKIYAHNHLEPESVVRQGDKIFLKNQKQ
jgi:LysM repeat protein